VALFWEPAINIQYIEIVRAIIADTNHSLDWDTRFVAAFQVVTTDADIDLQREVQVRPLAPRDGDPRGQPRRHADPTWTRIHHAVIPEYPSGHGGYAGAVSRC